MHDKNGNDWYGRFMASSSTGSWTLPNLLKSSTFCWGGNWVNFRTFYGQLPSIDFQPFLKWFDSAVESCRTRNMCKKCLKNVWKITKSWKMKKDDTLIWYWLQFLSSWLSLSRSARSGETGWDCLSGALPKVKSWWCSLYFKKCMAAKLFWLVGGFINIAILCTILEHLELGFTNSTTLFFTWQNKPAISSYISQFQVLIHCTSLYFFKCCPPWNQVFRVIFKKKSTYVQPKRTTLKTCPVRVLPTFLLVLLSSRRKWGDNLKAEDAFKPQAVYISSGGTVSSLEALGACELPVEKTGKTNHVTILMYRKQKE